MSYCKDKMHQIRFPLGRPPPDPVVELTALLNPYILHLKGPTSNWRGRGKGRAGKERKGRGEWRGGNGREERASHTFAALGLAKPRAGSVNMPTL